jgi:hypothetical protein
MDQPMPRRVVEMENTAMLKDSQKSKAAAIRGAHPLMAIH